jgi:hypothetical protein
MNVGNKWKAAAVAINVGSLMVGGISGEQVKNLWQRMRGQTGRAKEVVTTIPLAAIRKPDEKKSVTWTDEVVGLKKEVKREFNIALLWEKNRVEAQVCDVEEAYSVLMKDLNEISNDYPAEYSRAFCVIENELCT